MEEIAISVSKNFSRTPGAGKRSEGKYSGEEFLEDVLEPAFLKAVADGGKVKVVLDGTIGYGTAFLEQSFGGLARKYPEKSILDFLNFVSDEEPYLVQELIAYVRDANKK